MSHCKRNWARYAFTVLQLPDANNTTYFACWCRQSYFDAEFGECERSRLPPFHKRCAKNPGQCITAFPTSPAAQRWASCDDVAALRKRGQAYEHAWMKAMSRELDLMIEIERLKREVAAAKVTP